MCAYLNIKTFLFTASQPSGALLNTIIIIYPQLPITDTNLWKSRGGEGASYFLYLRLRRINGQFLGLTLPRVFCDG